jgi:crossover junction endodeoxyribonuclease RuvC
MGSSRPIPEKARRGVPLQARILGIDPGSQVTGYGIVESRDGRIVHVAHGTVRASRERSTERRLADLYRSLLVFQIFSPFYFERW